MKIVTLKFKIVVERFEYIYLKLFEKLIFEHHIT